jgi:hypothetical protein
MVEQMYSGQGTAVGHFIFGQNCINVKSAHVTKHFGINNSDKNI